VVTLILLVVVLVIGMVSLMQENERVNNEDLKNYVEAYLRKYKEVC